MLIDSHVNLHAPQFDEDRDAVIDRARAAGVGLMVEISDRLTTFEATHGLAMAAVFRQHVRAARETGLPLVIHTREADAAMGDILRAEYAAGPFKMLMHCYTSGAELAKIAAEMGAWFSVSGIATFKAAEDVRAVIRDMPGDRIIVETDCPYLAPIPHRGRRNEPAYVGLVLDKLAEIRGWSAEQAERITTEAFFGLFDRIPKPA